MYSLVPAALGTYIVNFVVLSAVCAGVLLITLAILMFLRLVTKCCDLCYVVCVRPGVYIVNSSSDIYKKFNSFKPPQPPEHWV